MSGGQRLTRKLLTILTLAIAAVILPLFFSRKVAGDVAPSDWQSNVTAATPCSSSTPYQIRGSLDHTNPNPTTGVGTYTVHVSYRACYPNYKPVDFAVTGMPSGGGSNLCPMVGAYGLYKYTWVGHGSDYYAFDCVKYQPKCTAGGPSGCINRTNSEFDKVYRSGLPSTSWSDLSYTYNYYTARGSNNVSIASSGTPQAGNYKILDSACMGMYWSGIGATSPQLCYNLTLTLYWQMNGSITTDISMSPTNHSAAYSGSSAKVKEPAGTQASVLNAPFGSRVSWYGHVWNTGNITGNTQLGMVAESVNGQLQGPSSSWYNQIGTGNGSNHQPTKVSPQQNNIPSGGEVYFGVAGFGNVTSGNLTNLIGGSNTKCTALNKICFLKLDQHMDINSQSYVGNTYCRNAWWYWDASANINPTAGYSGWGCAYVPWSYHFNCPASNCPAPTPKPDCSTSTTSCPNPGSAGNDKAGPQTWVNNQQPTGSCSDLSGTYGSQSNCLTLTGGGQSKQKITFSHSVTNFGPTKRWDPTYVMIKHPTNPGGTWGSATTGSGTKWNVDTKDSDISGYKDIWNKTENSFDIDFANDAGKIWCSELTVSPGGYSNGTKLSDATSTHRCVHVPYSYQVSVTGRGDVTTNSDGSKDCSGGTTQVGTSTSLSFSINAASGSISGSSATKSLPIHWRVVDDAGHVISNALVHPSSPTGGQTFTPGQSLTVSVDISAQETVGEIASYHLQLSDNGTSWSNSTSPILTVQDGQKNHSTGGGSCTTFTKMPQLNIYGADSFAQGGFSGSASSLPASGSWSQYGLLTNTGTINRFGSAGWNLNGDTRNRACSLDFANTGTIGSGGYTGATCSNVNSPLGNLGMSRELSEPKTPYTFVKTSSLEGTVDPGYQYTQDGWYLYTSDITLKGSDAGNTNRLQYNFKKPDLHAVIYVKGNVHIAANIYSATQAGGTLRVSELASLPNLTIYAIGNIQIDPEVTEIEANLVANGTISTCGVDDLGESSALGENGRCSTQSLKINGAVISPKSPRFQRTIGGEVGNLSLPAETIDYTPNLYLSPYFNSTAPNQGGENWEVTQEVNLPPRY